MEATSLLAGIRTRMENLAARQRVIAQNIANGDTPGYKAREVAEPSFAGLVDGSRPTIAAPRVELTAGMKGLGALEPSNGGGTILDTDISETKPDGNNVTLEDQLLKLGQVQADFATVTNLYRKQMAMLRTATGRGGSG